MTTDWSWKPPKVVRSQLRHGEKKLRELRILASYLAKPPAPEAITNIAKSKGEATHV